MGTRRQARECALQILYQLDPTRNADGSVDGRPVDGRPVDGARIDEAVARFFDHFDAPEKARSLAVEIVRGVIDERASLDPLIQRHSPRWRLERMAIVDRNVLRIGAWELLFKKDVPPKVVIDEAIEVAKRFGTDTSAAFVNGVLDAAAKEISGGHATKAGEP